MTTQTAGQGVPLQAVLGEFIQLAVHDRFEQIEQVGPKAKQQRLDLGIAKPAIELEDTGPLIRNHEAGVEHALERPSAALERVNGRHEN